MKNHQLKEARKDFAKLLKEEHVLWVPFLLLFTPIWFLVAFLDSIGPRG